MANNNSIYNAVIAGAGGANQERWIASVVSGTYTTYRQAVEQIAAAIDAAIPAGTITVPQLSLMQSICQGVFAGRFPTATSYTAVASAIVALYTALSVGLLPDDVVITTDQVLNVSEVPGTTATDALDYLNTKLTIEDEPDATRTVTAADSGKLIRCTNAAGCVITVDDDVFTRGDFFLVRQVGAGIVSFNGSMTITPPVTSVNTTGQQGATIAIVFLAADAAESMGDLSDA